MKTLSKILAVDDEQDILTVIRYAFDSNKNITLKTGSSGEEALRIAPDFQPDVVLLDLKMPFMDGLEVFRALKANPKTKSTSIIFLTAVIEKAKFQQYMEMGVAEIILKPFDPWSLLSRVEEIWNRHYH